MITNRQKPTVILHIYSLYHRTKQKVIFLDIPYHLVNKRTESRIRLSVPQNMFQINYSPSCQPSISRTPGRPVNIALFVPFTYNNLPILPGFLSKEIFDVIPAAPGKSDVLSLVFIHKHFDKSVSSALSAIITVLYLYNFLHLAFQHDPQQQQHQQ